MFSKIQEANELFEAHVPFSDAAFLILKAQLVIELQVLKFIKARTSSDLFDMIEKRPDFFTRVLLARALAERDEISPLHADILWDALRLLGKLRNEVAHYLEHKGSSLEDRMALFIETMDPDGELFPRSLLSKDLHQNFRIAAFRLNSLLVINHEPFTLTNETQSF